MPLVTAQVIGEMPNRDGLQRYQTRSGKRMRQLAGRTYHWQNLFDSYRVWSAPDAREAADAWVFLYGHAIGPLILLGRRVCRAFGVEDDEWLEWYRRPDLGCAMIAFPHPSPLNRWWNDSDNEAQARDLLQKISAGEVPRINYHKLKEGS